MSTKLINLSSLELKEKFNALNTKVSSLEGVEKGEAIKSMIKIVSVLLYQTTQSQKSHSFSIREMYHTVKKLYAENSMSGVTILREFIHYLTEHLDESYSKRNDSSQLYSIWTVNGQIEAFEL